MTPTFKTAIQETAVNDAGELLVSGADHELVLSFLREKGFNKIDSIKALVSAGGMALQEAKLIVHNSKTWNDVYDRDERFHKNIGETVDDLERGREL
jgi:ribosomal protein L7/L12